MNNRYYFDTSIWIDIYDQRGYNGKVAKQLMKKIILASEIIIYSDVVIIELKRLGFSEHEINQIIGIARPDHSRRVHSTKSQLEEAIKLAKQRNVPLRDALQAILARDHGAQLVSRDWDFEQLKDITTTRKPEELI